MTIVTKRGDKGMASLRSGRRVPKDDSRLEACGALDELCSSLGFARSIARSKSVKKLIESIQRDLFVVGSSAGAECHFPPRLKETLGDIHVRRLEDAIRLIERDKGFTLKSFCLPGENTIAAALDIARTVARRAERCAVTLQRKRMLSNRFVIVYLNRLSDLLYLMARAHEKRHREVHAR